MVVESVERPLLLELFCGTAEVSRAFRRRGWETWAVDNDPKSNADELCDVLRFEWRGRRPDVIWASPPCTQYSQARRNAGSPPDLAGADALVARTLEIVRNLRPRYFFIENPQTGLLKSRAVVAGIPFVDCAYCQYGELFRKKTRIWTNHPSLRLATCPGAGKCAAMEGRGHKQTFSNASKPHARLHGWRRLSKVPFALASSVAAQCVGRDGRE